MDSTKQCVGNVRFNYIYILAWFKHASVLVNIHFNDMQIYTYGWLNFTN